MLYRNDLVNSNYSQVYTYDSLNRLTGFTQGHDQQHLNGIVGTPSDSGTYTMDSVGNMTTFGSGSRTVNAQNELTSGPFTPVYDADGNLVSGLPAVAAGSPVSLSLVYDAWNDVVGIKNVPGHHLGDLHPRRQRPAGVTNQLAGDLLDIHDHLHHVFSAAGPALEDDQPVGQSRTGLKSSPRTPGAPADRG